MLGLHSGVISNLFAYFEERASCGRSRQLMDTQGALPLAFELPQSFVSTWPGTKVSQVSFSEDINFEPGVRSEQCEWA